MGHKIKVRHKRAQSKSGAESKSDAVEEHRGYEVDSEISFPQLTEPFGLETISNDCNFQQQQQLNVV